MQQVLLSNKVNYWTGTECRAFEKEFAAWAETKHAVALSNGTLYQGSCSEVYLEKAFDGTGWRPVAKALGETSLMWLVHPTLTSAEMHQTAQATAGA